MDPTGSLPNRRLLSGGLLLAGGVAYAIVASFTRPFTPAADLVTALPLALAAAIFTVRIRASRRAPALTEPPHPDDDGRKVSRRHLDRYWLPWLILAAVVIGWELFTYVSSPRRAYPTLSSLIDILDSSHIGKSFAFLVWLLLGWYLLQ